MRENLIELLSVVTCPNKICNFCEHFENGVACERHRNEVIADHLIANGVTVQEHGEWIDKGWDGDFSWRIDGRGNCWHVYECSNCKNELCGIPKTNYCPNCGSKMI